MILRCDLTKQYKYFEKDILETVKKVLNSGHYILAEENKSFEMEFSSYCGAKFGVTVASGTEALYLSLITLGIGKGDEIITSPFSPIPTVSAIAQTGARAVFVDINKNDFLIDVNQIEDKITSKTKAVIPIHLFGDVVKMDLLLDIAKKYNLFVVEDACQAHGSSYKKKKVGAWGDLGCFSFYPTKNLGGYGDGGIITTNNLDFNKRLRLLRDYGKDGSFTSVTHGINSRMDEIQAAILRIKLFYLDKLNEKRRKLASIYFSRLKNTPLKLPIASREIVHNYHIFTIRCLEKRDSLRSYLEKKQIQTNVYYPIAMHLQKAYQYLGYKKGGFPLSERACEEVIALPMYSELEPKIINKVCDEIVHFYKL